MLKKFFIIFALIFTLFTILSFSAVAENDVQTSTSSISATIQLTVSSTTAYDGQFGDANSDGTVNIKDILEIKRYLARFDVPIDLYYADVNQDTAVNAKDLLYLRYYLAKYDVKLGQLVPMTMPTTTAQPTTIPTTATPTTTAVYKKIVYGKSYQNRNLEAYVFNENGTKTMFCDFAVHGFEDEYAKDGKVLVNCANKIIEFYKKNIKQLNGWRLVIVPCANPDGTYYGNNNYRADNSKAFGRCTANHIDMNRDFLTGRFKAKESVALKNLMIKYKPNMYINFHGWLDTTIGDSTICKAFRTYVGLSGNQEGQYGADKGYIIGYAKNTLKIPHAALIEFKSTDNVDYLKVIKALKSLMK